MFNRKTFKNNYKFFITVFLIGIFFLTSFVSIGYSALNKDIKVSGDIDYTKYEVWAENLSYDNTDTGINCTTAQCMLDCIADNNLCP